MMEEEEETGSGRGIYMRVEELRRLPMEGTKSLQCED